MKRTVAAVALMIAVTALCFFENRYFEKLCAVTVKELSVCEELYRTDRGLCAKKCEKLKKEWEVDARRAGVFINHRRIDEISADMAALPVYALYGNGDFSAACARIGRAFERLRSDQHLTLESFY